jgi:hypothetical protein
LGSAVLLASAIRCHAGLDPASISVDQTADGSRVFARDDSLDNRDDSPDPLLGDSEWLALLDSTWVKSISCPRADTV